MEKAACVENNMFQRQYVIPLLLWTEEPLGFMVWLKMHDLQLKVLLDEIGNKGRRYTHVHNR